MALDPASVTPIADLINMIIAPLTSAALPFAGSLVTSITPVLLSLFSIYVLIKTVNILRGMDDTAFVDFGWFLFGFFIVLSMAIHYETTILPLILQFADSAVGSSSALYSGGSASVSTTPMDTVMIYYVDQFSALQNEISEMGVLEQIPATLGLWAKWFIVNIGLIPMIIAATLIYLSLYVGLVLVLALGPLFIALGLFPATRQYASAFVNTVFSYILGLTLLSIVGIAAINLSKDMFTLPSGTVELTFPVAIYSAIGNLMLVFVLKQVASIAASLSAGGINAGFAQASIRDMARNIAGSFARVRKADGSRGAGLGIGSQSVDIASAGARELRKLVSKNNTIKAG